jgi:hypothetical protein
MDFSPKRSVIREVLISQDGKVDLGEIASAIAAFSPGRANNRYRQGTGCRPKALGISSGCFLQLCLAGNPLQPWKFLANVPSHNWAPLLALGGGATVREVRRAQFAFAGQLPPYPTQQIASGYLTSGSPFGGDPMTPLRAKYIQDLSAPRQAWGRRRSRAGSTPARCSTRPKMKPSTRAVLIEILDLVLKMKNTGRVS